MFGEKLTEMMEQLCESMQSVQKAVEAKEAKDKETEAKLEAIYSKVMDRVEKEVLDKQFKEPFVALLSVHLKKDLIDWAEENDLDDYVGGIEEYVNSQLYTHILMFKNHAKALIRQYEKNLKNKKSSEDDEL